MNFESLILSHHFMFNVSCECNKEEINDDETNRQGVACGRRCDASGGGVPRPRRSRAESWLPAEVLPLVLGRGV